MDDVANMTEAEYGAFVNRLKELTAKELAEADSSAEALEAAILRYLHAGYQARLTRGEIIDFFCVDGPSILDLAAIAGEEADEIVRRFDELNRKIFALYWPTGGPAAGA